MIQIKISADNERLLRSAKTEPELRGVVDLILERIDQAKTTTSMRRAKELSSSRTASIYTWQVAKDVMGKILGDDLKFPPFPDPIWYQRIHRTMKQYDMREEKLTELAKYAKENLKAPYSLDFLVCQHERVLAGAFDIKWKKGATTDAAYVISGWRNNLLPEE